MSLHVRHGDYLTHKQAKLMFPILDMSYYARASDYLADRIGRGRHLFVFSDDPEWCRENVGRSAGRSRALSPRTGRFSKS